MSDGLFKDFQMMCHEFSRIFTDFQLCLTDFHGF